MMEHYPPPSLPLPVGGGWGQGQEHTVLGRPGVGRGGGAGDTEEGTLENTFLNWLLFYHFLTVAVGNSKGFLILRKYTSQVRLAGTLIIQAEERLGKARFDLDLGCCSALSSERQLPFPPQPSSGSHLLAHSRGSVPLAASSMLAPRIAQCPPILGQNPARNTWGYSITPGAVCVCGGVGSEAE